MTEKASELAELRIQRASTKGCITRIKNLVEQRGDTLSEPELECRLGILESYFKQILAFQSAIEKLEPEDLNEAKTRSDIEDLYCAVKSKLIQLLSGSRQMSIGNYSSLLPGGATTSHLPKLKLPQFSGIYSEFPNFIGSFTTLVEEDKSLSAFEKFNHLLACLKGPALRTIKAFDITEANYPKALEHLKSRYDNKYLIFQEHVTKLFALPKVQKNSPEQLRNLIDSVNAHFSALQSLGSFDDIVNSFILHLATSKLDSDSQGKWEEVVELSKFPKWSECAELLHKRCLYLEARDGRRSDVEQRNGGRNNDTKAKRNIQNSSSFTTVESLCSFCRSKGHFIDKCAKFLELPVQDRFNECKKRVLCINCLAKGHTVRKCKAVSCRVCFLPHHTLLHRYNKAISQCEGGPSASTSPVVASPLGEPGQTVEPLYPSSSLPASAETNHVFLATAVVKVRDKFGQYHLARALLDSASQLNFVTEHLAQTLQLNRRKTNTQISGIGDTLTTVRYKTLTTIRSRINDFESSLEMYVIPYITGMKPEKRISVEHWNIPKNLPLADPLFFKPQRLDLLLGADTFFRLLCTGQVQIDPDLPVLQKTLLGWIISGNYLEKPDTAKHLSCHVVSSTDLEEQDVQLNKLVERFWHDENVDQPAVKWNDEQSTCERIFLTTCRRSPDGRFIVRLPFKAPLSELGNSFDMAKRRFYWLERRLQKHPTLKVAYSEFLKEYLEADHMERVSLESIPKEHYFMPHHCVLRPDSTTTKLRVVFDASAQTSSTKSLNDLLMVGPIIQDELFSIILRFRCYQFALTADIAAMYRQVLVDVEHRNVQLILWRENPTEELQVFRLKTVTYGTASAPFLATRCLIELSKQYAEIYPETAKVIAKDFYMDDLITGADSLEDLCRIRSEVTSILDSAQFKLRKWYSNHAEILLEIPDSDRERPLRINDTDIIKTLGIAWEPKIDSFRFYYNLESLIDSTKRTTKRTILSDMAKLYDPLGLINPVIVKAKVFLQELWIMKVAWDESLSQEIEARWTKFKADLRNLHKILIPRVIITQNAVSVELHGFADASVRAYGCCVYVRCINVDGRISTGLLVAKSKVAPIRVTRSLPCLELCAALLLAKLIEKAKSSLVKPVERVYCWTDSEIVLDWISCHPSNWTTYVANRVSEIHRLTSDFTWRHVNSKANPADIVSRGSTVTDLIDSSWFSGPYFLHRPVADWPPLKRRHDLSLVPERRKIKSILVSAKATNPQEVLNKVYECSTFMKNCKRFGWVLRFIKNLKHKTRGEALVLTGLSAEEVEDAFLQIIWLIQQTEFAKELQELRVRKELNHSTLQKLTPFLDDSANVPLLRVGGRLKNSDLPYESRHPILLPRDNLFVKSYILHLHIKNFHAGPLALVAILRQRFWVINAREYCRRIVRQCIHCFRYRPKLAQQIMGHLPRSRSTACLPFVHSGVDYCGPFRTTLKLRGRHTFKSYAAVFVCFATKAVHIEVVSDLSSDAFIAALKRFVGRRNLCKYLYCDNATNFVGAQRQLKELREQFLDQHSQSKIQDWCLIQGINFKFIPPRAPHFGGLWESAVKSAKNLLFKTLRDSLLTFEELSTVMVQIEAVLNSRPITPLSDDPNDEEALTPAHFLMQAPIEGVIEPNISERQNFSYLGRWQRITALQQHFWRRWSKEYVTQLQEKTKWQSSQPNIKPGMLVVIHQDDAPPFKWRLGRVVDTTAGGDGRVRVVSIRTAGTTIERPIHKIAVLPVPEDVEY